MSKKEINDTFIVMRFNPTVAKNIGVEEAIMFSNICYWVEKNKSNDKHKHDGAYWTYNSMRAFSELFPFWTKRQIERILKNLEEEGYIKTGNYNKHKYDRTKWYSINPDKKTHLTKRVNGKSQTVKPIPNSKPNSKHNNQTSSSKKKKKKPTNIQKVVNYFFELKGWDEEDLEKRKIKYGRYVRPAKEVLILADDDVEAVKSVLDDLKAWADEEDLEWSLETAIKRWEALTASEDDIKEKKQKERQKVLDKFRQDNKWTPPS